MTEDLMPQVWFEMIEARRRKLDLSVWIPLRAAKRDRIGEFGQLGMREEFFGAGSVAVPVAAKEVVETLGWDDIGLRRDHSPWAQADTYTPSDVINLHGEDGLGVALALAQPGNSDEPSQWHLHQDLVIALHLKREGDVWLAIDEGYADVARLVRGKDGSPDLLEIRAQYLKDYLCARNMGLYISSYRQCSQIVIDAAHINWPAENRKVEGSSRWEGRVSEIHEGGFPFGATTAVMHFGRTDVYAGEDVPQVNVDDENITSRSWSGKRQGRKLFRIDGELWRNEWINPADRSIRVRDDLPAQAMSFITEASGTRKIAEKLVDSGQWLWFRPDVISILSERRGGWLKWYTRDTGSVSCAPDSGVHFGVNPLGLINVYAKDIALLAPWKQQLWAGANVTPEGGVSKELLSAQAMGEPAETRAPEAFLRQVFDLLNQRSQETWGLRMFREHKEIASLLSRCHRFRSIDKNGLLSLAKDIARLTADSIDGAALQKVVSATSGKVASLKALENAIASKSDQSEARSLMGPLFGIYELRLADAHLPGDLEAAFKLAGIDEREPFVMQGFQLLDSCVSTLYAIANLLKAKNGQV